MSTPRLWSWQLSPYAGKARVALAVRGVEVDLLEIDPLHRPARLRELNPANRVPVLELDGVAVPQSTAICEWAQESGSGPSLWPEDPLLRARARGLLRWVEDELVTNYFLSMRKQAYGLDPRVDHPDLVATLRGALARRWGAAEALLEAGSGMGSDGWLLGAGPYLCDLGVMSVAVRLPAWTPELAPDPEQHPHVGAWLAALRAHPHAGEINRRGEPVSA